MIKNKYDLIILGSGIVGTWIAKRALEKNKKIAVIEIGPPSPNEKHEPKPKLFFPERVNAGTLEARNQCLTGNSRFWGGGLIRNDIKSLETMLNIKDNSNLELMSKISNCYYSIEKDLKVPISNRETRKFGDGINLTVSNILVLSGRKRDLWEKFYKTNEGNKLLKLFVNAVVTEVIMGKDNDKIKSITVKENDSQYTELFASEFVLTMGVVDNNIFVQQHFPFIRSSNNLVGEELHDHWSIPIGSISWKRATILTELFPPSFQKGSVTGRRIELRLNNQEQTSAFIHFQVEYDKIEPYQTLKQILFNHQKSLSGFDLVKKAIGLIPFPKMLAKLGWEKYWNQRVYIPDGTNVKILLDFESCSDRRNKILFTNKEAVLNWDLRENDFKNFNELFQSAENIIHKLAKIDPSIKDLELIGNTNNTLEKHLVNEVIDAYHLGGGLRIGSDHNNSIIDYLFKFHSIKNIAALGTSLFNRPGIGNPVYTLLASAEYYVSTLN